MSRKFCIMTYGRSGSTALMGALAARDDVGVPSKNIESADEELFHPDRLEHYLRGYRNLTGRPIGDVPELISRFFEHNSDYSYTGFKSMPHRHVDFSRFVRRDDIQFIALTREDLTSTVASFFAARQHKAWRQSGRSTPWTYEASHQKRIEKLVAYVRNETTLLQSMPRAIRLSYEQLCDPQFAHSELDDFFGQPVRLDNPRPPTSGADYVENWDELCSFIRSVTDGAHSLLNQSVAVASAAVISDPSPEAELPHLSQLSPLERLDRGIPLFGANYVERQLLYEESQLELLRYREAFEQLETYCTFIGHSFSGHSIVGALLDAHPQMVIAHELDAIRFVQAGFSDEQIYYLLLKNSQAFAELGRSWNRYSYAVPEQHQGAFTSLKVIGDKKAGGTSLLLSNDWSLLDALEDTIPLDQKFIHVIRNPFDNIATTSVRKTGSLERAVQWYFGLCKANQAIIDRVGADNVFQLHQEEFIGDPSHWLERLCSFLGVDAGEDYLQLCTSIVYKQPHKSRESIQWPTSAVDYIHRAMEGFDCLSRYSFDR